MKKSFRQHCCNFTRDHGHWHRIVLGVRNAAGTGMHEKTGSAEQKKRTSEPFWPLNLATASWAGLA
jgi:hypothetical protein